MRGLNGSQDRLEGIDELFSSIRLGELSHLIRNNRLNELLVVFTVMVMGISAVLDARVSVCARIISYSLHSVSVPFLPLFLR